MQMNHGGSLSPVRSLASLSVGGVQAAVAREQGGGGNQLGEGLQQRAPRTACEDAWEDSGRINCWLAIRPERAEWLAVRRILQ